MIPQTDHPPFDTLLHRSIPLDLHVAKDLVLFIGTKIKPSLLMQNSIADFQTKKKPYVPKIKHGPVKAEELPAKPPKDFRGLGYKTGTVYY